MNEPTTFVDPCGPMCWTPVPCPECGNGLPPRGRDVPISVNIPECCERHRYATFNHRHLWSKDELE